ncbi:MAG TPA: XrtA system polysaccharide chain length determinant [Lysobacter sp.]
MDLTVPETRPSAVAAMVPVAFEEWRRRPVMLATVFTLIALAALAFGLVLPKKYNSQTTILVEESNIIKPLMEGRAVPTSVVSRAAITREVAFSRKVMDDILKTGGWMARNPTPLQQDQLIEMITGRTIISNPRDNLIRVSYTDTDAARAHAVTKRFAELIIQESLATKERESRDAYDFIDSQVRAYHKKLTDAESKLEAYRKSNPDARPGIDGDVNSRIGELRRMVDTSRMELMDLESQGNALGAQLNGENEINVVQTRSGQLLARMAELETEHDRLLMNYTEQHPDVVRVQHQIRDLEEEVRREDARQAARKSAGPAAAADATAATDAGNATALGGVASFNPLYGELKSKMAENRRQAAAVSSRIATSQALLDQELSRSRQIAASESTLAELSRDYEVNRDLYQDLLKRRENARVSMSLDAEQRGLSFRVQEPASFPLRGVGLRLVHVASAGLGAAALAPLLLLFGFVRLDPRVRSPYQIETAAALPVLGAVPRYQTAPSRRLGTRRFVIAAMIFLVVPLVYGLALVLKMVTLP